MSLLPYCQNQTLQPTLTSLHFCNHVSFLYSQWSNSLLVLQIVQRIEISPKILAAFTPFRSQRRVKISSQLLFSLKIEENQLGKLTILSKKRICKKGFATYVSWPLGSQNHLAQPTFVFPAAETQPAPRQAGR